MIIGKSHEQQLICINWKSGSLTFYEVCHLLPAFFLTTMTVQPKNGIKHDCWSKWENMGFFFLGVIIGMIMRFAAIGKPAFNLPVRKFHDILSFSLTDHVKWKMENNKLTIDLLHSLHHGQDSKTCVQHFSEFWSTREYTIMRFEAIRNLLSQLSTPCTWVSCKYFYHRRLYICGQYIWQTSRRCTQNGKQPDCYEICNMTQNP